MAAYLAMMIGLVQRLAGLLDFGEVTKFISRSVVMGALNSVIPAFAGFHFGPRKRQPFPERIGTAIAVSFLGMLEAASITKSLAAKSGQKIEPNQNSLAWARPTSPVRCSVRCRALRRLPTRR